MSCIVWNVVQIYTQCDRCMRTLKYQVGAECAPEAIAKLARAHTLGLGWELREDGHATCNLCKQALACMRPN